MYVNVVGEGRYVAGEGRYSERTGRVCSAFVTARVDEAGAKAGCLVECTRVRGRVRGRGHFSVGAEAEEEEAAGSGAIDGEHVGRWNGSLALHRDSELFGERYGAGYESLKFT